MRALGMTLASCIAHYASRNPAGVDDKRLPWPAPLSLPDYRIDASYDDVNSGMYSGRLADIVDTSNTDTGNTLNRIVSDCDSVSVPGWTPRMQSKWQHWKDHFFYAVAGSFAPNAATPSVCTNCLTVNGGGQYAGIVLFSGRRLAALGQIRNAPPLDTDTKNVSSNYVEGTNAASIPGDSTANNFASQATTSTFNDLLFCIDDQLIVTEC